MATGPLSRLRKATRLWRTVRPLMAVQLAGRLRHELRLRAFERFPGLLAARLGGGTDAPEVKIQRLTARVFSAQRARAESSMSGSILLAGHTVGITDWSRSELPKLVRYHLQYLDAARDLAEVSSADGKPELLEAALALFAKWHAENPLRGSEAWEPYVVSARLQNLVFVALQLGPAAPRTLRDSLVEHARFVLAFPEVHLQANHLLKNWTALALGGLILEGPEAKTWAEAGLRGVDRELGEQILSDGGHYERSAMYHALVLADLLDVRDVARAVRHAVPVIEKVIEGMGRFAGATAHPDGDVPFFNDAVIGQAPRVSELLARWGEGRGEPPASFGPGEYGLVVERASDEVLFFDAGPLGPTHQPGHAHSDTLSYELSLGGERRAVNAGLDGYQSSNRDYFRSAAAHNGIVVDEESPDEIWSGFRVGGRSRVLGFKRSEAGDGFVLQAELQAFQGWAQSRTLLYLPGRALVVLDRVVVKRWVKVGSRVQLLDGMVPIRFQPLLGLMGGEQARYSPRFNAVRTIPRHEVSAAGTTVHLGYALLFRTAPDARAEADDGRWRVELDGRSFNVPISVVNR